jgi:probable HAF family extracellular repeat protein
MLPTNRFLSLTVWCAAVCFLLLPPLEAWPTANNFIPIDFPGAASTSVSDINNQGEIVGGYYQSPGHPEQTHGFLFDNGAFATIDVPGAAFTTATGINDRGQIVGWYSGSNGSGGFLFQQGTFTTIDFGDRTALTDINNRGQIVGSAIVGNSFTQSFLWDHGTVTPLDTPLHGSVTGINNQGQIIGNTNANVGFLVSHGTVTTIQAPGALETVADGINDRGQIVGYVVVASGISGFRGLIYDKGQFTILDTPGLTITGMNNAGLFVGNISDPGGSSHAFLDPPAQTPEPASLLLMVSGLAALAISGWRGHANTRR